MTVLTDLLNETYNYLKETYSRVNYMDTFLPSDKEDFIIILIEADDHCPDLAFNPNSPVDQLKISSVFSCKPPLHSKTLAEGQTLDDFFNKNITFYKEHMAINYNILKANNKKQHF